MLYYFVDFFQIVFLRTKVEISSEVWTKKNLTYILLLPTLICDVKSYCFI